MPDTALLLAISAPILSEPLRLTIRTLVSQQPDWTPIVQAALESGTAGLLADRLLRLAPDLLPDELLAAFGSFRDHCIAEDLRHTAQLADLLATLAHAGVTALPFKGPALARLAYDDPRLRQCRDLDLLIRPADIEPCLTALAGLGYRSQYPDLRPTLRRAYHRYNGQDMLLAPDRLAVEPHWAFAPRTLAAALDTGAMFARAQPVQIAGSDTLTLAPEDALAVAALHGCKEEWARLIWIADLAGLLVRHPGIDTTRVLARARAAGQARMLLIGVALAQDLLDTPCPAPLAAALAADPVARRLAAEITSRLGQDGRSVPSVFALTRFRWQMRERPSDRLRYAAATLLAARVPHYGVIDLPDALIGLYPLVRLAHDFVALPLVRSWRKLAT